MDIFLGLGNPIGDVILGILLLVAGFLILRIFILFLKNWWLDESQKKFVAGIEYVLLEIKFPKNNETFPKAMEQVFASFYQVYTFGIKPENKWFEGQIEEKISVEMVSSKGGIKFFIRVNKKNRPVIENAILAQYPTSEITEAPSDYVKEFPANLPNDEYDIMGADMILGRDSAYPMRTYPYFFGERKYEEQEVDPIAVLAEVMSNLKAAERMWVQVLIRPAGDKLKEAAKKLIDEKMGKKEDPKKGVLGTFFGFVGALFEFVVQTIQALVKSPEWKDPAKTEDKPKNLTSIDNEIIRAIDAKASKLAFDAIVRIIYIDKKDSFSGSNFKAATSAFQQFSISNLNFMRPARLTMTIPLRFYVPRRKQRLLEKKKRIYKNYITRDFTGYTNVEEMYREHLKPSLMNIEELATIFHPPISRVAAVGLGQQGPKKGAPPANLPIE